MVELFFGIAIITAVTTYFYKRKKKLARMGLRDQIDDMFSEH